MARDLLARRAVATPRAIAVEAPAGTWSYRELDVAAERVAAGLRAAGLGHGSIVAALLPVTSEGVAAAHGVPRAGAALAPAGIRWTESELRRFALGLEPAGLLGPLGAPFGRAGAARIGAEGPARPSADLPGAAVGGSAGRLLASAGLRLYRLEGGRRPLPPDTHSVLWTSGTEGAPRAVPLTLANHLAVARGAARRLGLGPADRWLASLALSHVGGLALVLRAAYTGARLVSADGRFRPQEMERLAREGRITHASLVPAMLHLWLEERGRRSAPPALRAVLVGGAPVPSTLLERALSSGVPVALTYGLTEAASQVATAPPALVRGKPGTAGPPLAGVRLRVVEGEIRIRGRSVMRGYLDPPGSEPAGFPGAATARIPGAEPSGVSGSAVPFDADGWLRTGDVGELDAEGHLRVLGRLGDRIITGGVNVDPAEVEAALDGAPGVAELAIGSVCDQVWGERLVALAVPRSPAAGLDREALERFARTRLSSPRRPRAWIAADAVPRNPNGKVDRQAVRTLMERELRSTRGPARC